MTISRPAAEDLAADMHAEANRQADLGYYTDASDLADAADELDAAVAAAAAAGTDVTLPDSAEPFARQNGMI